MRVDLEGAEQAAALHEALALGGRDALVPAVGRVAVGGVLPVPVVPAAHEAGHRLRLRGGEVARLARIGAQVVEAALAGGGVAHELPAALAHGPGVAVRVRAPLPPEERPVGIARGLPAQEGVEVHAVGGAVGIGRDARLRERGGGDVEADHGRVVAQPLRPARGPGRDEGHAQAALVEARLAVAQRAVVGPVPPPQQRGHAAVVGEEEDDRVVARARLLQRRQHAPHVLVERPHHGQVGAALLVLDVPVLADEGGGRLQRFVRGVVGEVEEEGRVVPFADEGRGARRERVREVAVELDLLAVLLERQEVGVAVRAAAALVVVVAAPEEAVEGVEAAVAGVEGLGRPQLPLAHEPRAVARALETAGEGRLPGGQPVGGVVGREGEVLVVAEARGIAPREQARARGAAEGVGHVAVGEDDALRRQPVEVGRPRLVPAREPGVAVAQVVDEDEDDVGAPVGAQFGRGALRRGAAGRRQQARQAGERERGGDSRHGPSQGGSPS